MGKANCSSAQTTQDYCSPSYYLCGGDDRTGSNSGRITSNGATTPMVSGLFRPLSNAISFSPSNQIQEHYIRSLVKIQSFYRGYRIRKSLRMARLQTYQIIQEKWICCTGDNQSNIDGLLSKYGHFNFGQYNQFSANSSISLQESNEDGVLETRSTTHFSDGSKYIGQWLAELNIRHGKGKTIMKNGSLYEGWWSHDEANGFGQFMCAATGDFFIGQWQNSMKNGFGTYIHADDSRYEGHWQHDTKHGYGYETWADKSYFKGEYVKGEHHGKGEYLKVGVGKYIGYFKNNKFEGNGTMVYEDGVSYTGQWLQNMKHGHGEIKLADNCTYKGYFRYNMYHGRGVFRWPDGRIYDGHYKDGEKHGLGEFIRADSEVLYGKWQNDQLILIQLNDQTERPVNEFQAMLLMGIMNITEDQETSSVGSAKNYTKRKLDSHVSEKDQSVLSSQIHPPMQTNNTNTIDLGTLDSRAGSPELSPNQNRSIRGSPERPSNQDQLNDTRANGRRDTGLPDEIEHKSDQAAVEWINESLQEQQ